MALRLPAAMMRWALVALALALVSPAAAAGDANRFAVAISNADRVVKCEVDRAVRRILCVAEMDAGSVDLFTAAIVRLSKRRQGLQLDGRTLALDGWTWVMVNFDGYGVSHDF